MQPILESLESRLLPSGIAAPQFVVLGLGGADPGPVAAEIGRLGIGPVATVGQTNLRPSESLQSSLNAVRATLYLNQSLYRGTDTVLVLVYPPGDGGPAISAGGPTTYHYGLSVAGGLIPIIGVPGTDTPQQAAPGLAFETMRIQTGNFYTDLTSPGPDSPAPPNFLLGDIVFAALAQYLGGRQ